MKLDRLKRDSPIVETGRLPTLWFQNLWQKVMASIEKMISDIVAVQLTQQVQLDAIIAAQAAAAAANAAAAAAQAAADSATTAAATANSAIADVEAALVVVDSSLTDLDSRVTALEP